MVIEELVIEEVKEERKGTPRQERRKRQKAHIPSPKAWIFNKDGTKELIDNPELDELISESKEVTDVT